MKKFFKFVRHIQLINCKIVVYSSKELMCLLRGDKLQPSFTSKEALKYMDALKRGENSPPLPMGAYEYHYCVDYLKIFRKKVIENENNLQYLALVFNEVNQYGIPCPPLEDCLKKVADEVGFELLQEEIHDNFYWYSFKSTL